MRERNEARVRVLAGRHRPAKAAMGIVTSLALVISGCATQGVSDEIYSGDEVDQEALIEAEVDSNILFLEVGDYSICSQQGASLSELALAACNLRAASVDAVANDPTFRSYFSTLTAGNNCDEGYVVFQQKLRVPPPPANWDPTYLCEFERIVDAANMQYQDLLSVVFTDDARAVLVRAAYSAMSTDPSVQQYRDQLQAALRAHPLQEYRAQMMEIVSQARAEEQEFIATYFAEQMTSSEDGAGASPDIGSRQLGLAVSDPTSSTGPADGAEPALGWIAMIVIAVLSIGALYLIADIGYNTVFYPAISCARGHLTTRRIENFLSQLPEIGSSYSYQPEQDFCNGYYRQCRNSGKPACSISELCPGGTLPVIPNNECGGW